MLVFTSSHRGAKQEELLVVSFEVGVFMVTGVLFNRKQQTLFSKTRMGSCLAQVRVREIILFGRSEGTFLNKLKNKVNMYIYIYARTHVRPHQIKYARRGINCMHVHDLHPCSDCVNWESSTRTYTLQNEPCIQDKRDILGIVICNSDFIPKSIKGGDDS